MEPARLGATDRIRSLNVISPDAEDLFYGPGSVRCVELHRACSLGDVRAVLERQLDHPTSPMTLDLMGHSTRDHHLLRMGDDRVDMLDPAVARFFRAVANDQLLSRLEVVTVRLLGCETAVTAGGQRTLRLLAHTLGLPVYGSIRPLLKSHYDQLGFNPAFAHVLVEGSSAVGR